MPPVASEAITPAYTPSLPNPARAAQSSDRAQSTPFESLLDDGTQAASDQTPPAPAPADETVQDTQPDSTPPATQGKHKKGGAAKTANAGATPRTTSKPTSKPTPKTADAINSADADQALADGNVVSNGKAKADAKIGEHNSKPADDSKTGDTKPTDGKQAAGLIPPDLSAVTAGNSNQTAIPVAPVAAAIAPIVIPQAVPTAVTKDASATVTQTAQATVLQAAVATSKPAIVAADTSKTKAADTSEIKTADASKVKPTGRATTKADVDKPGDDSTPSDKPVSSSQDGIKPQPTAGDTDKQTATHQHDEVPAASHHTATAEAQPAVAPDAQAAAPKAGADSVQQAALTATAPSNDVSQTTAPDAAPTAPAAAPAAQALAVPLAGVAVEIAGKALAGKNRFEIRLDPPELGRIEVRLDVDRDGHATTQLIADRSDTLDLLRRDSTGLERALQDAGLKTSDNGLQFSLRDQNMGRDQSNTPTPGAAQIVVKDDALAAADISSRSYSRLAGMGSGIDIRV